MSLQTVQGRISLEDLRLVQAIAEAGTLSGAAQRLRVDHSTAFRRLNALEDRLGVRLFLRARDGYTPTPAGEMVSTTAREVLSNLQALEHRLAGEDLRPSGVVRVTTTDTLLDFVAPGLASFRAAHPEITLEVVAANAFFTLTRRDADVAIRPTLTPPEELIGRRIAAIGIAPYATPAYLSKHPDARALAQYDWIAPDESLGHLSSAKWIAREIPAQRIVLKGSSLLALLAAARAGVGVAPIPCYLGDVDPELVRVAPQIPQMSSALWLLTHPDLRRVARIRAFLDYMAPWLADRRDLLEGRGIG